MPNAAANLIEETKMYAIKGVEVFSVGNWNGTKITQDDLNDMVRSFNDLKVGWRPCLKLGHDDKQLVAKATGLPAIGWIENLYARGDKLLADFHDIPERVFRLIKSKAYRKVSCEVYFDIQVSGVDYKAVLGAVALLGAEKPGVMNLNDILGQFAKWEQAEVFAILEKQDTFKQYSINFELNEEDGSMEIEQLEKNLAEQTKLAEENKAKFEAEAAKAKELEEKEKAREEELATLKKFKADAEAKAVQAEADKKKAELDATLTKFESKKLITPATRPIVESILEGKQNFSHEGKELSVADRLEKVLEQTVENAKVNFEESSLADKFSKDQEKDQEEKIQKYMEDNKCSYQVAYKSVMKSSKGQ